MDPFDEERTWNCENLIAASNPDKYRRDYSFNHYPTLEHNKSK